MAETAIQHVIQALLKQIVSDATDMLNGKDALFGTTLALTNSVDQLRDIAAQPPCPECEPLKLYHHQHKAGCRVRARQIREGDVWADDFRAMSSVGLDKQSLELQAGRDKARVGRGDG